MANLTNTSDYFWSFEYYWDYVDPVSVDGRNLEANKHSIVIAFWVGLAAFMLFLFLILLYMSRSGSAPVRNSNSRKRCQWDSTTHFHRLFHRHSNSQNHCTSPSSADSRIEELGETISNCEASPCKNLSCPDSALIITELCS
ncbi:melanocortin-2 receptor accessory protein [Rhinatrema bivittatum]|uniref:melanocortin-2 receptor accessory protein n=1 Tax=Rhinatrema bivittatum TaxID=194408 RepID=UPI00112B5AFA|nr:melanocortin-2 receptor accessory protein [Rhinatrema bivittatum]